jgi:ribosomal protein S18
MLSLSLPSRALARRSLLSTQNVLARHFTGPTLPTRRDSDTVDSTQATSDDTMGQITDILDVADLSTSPRSNNFSGKPLVASASQLSSLNVPGTLVGAKYERVRKGRLPKDQRVCSRAVLKFFSSFFEHPFFISIQFLKPTDLIPREDPFRRKRALLGPGAAESRKNDWFYQLGIDPLDEAMNSRLLSYFVTDMGKIKSRADTKLTWRNQRRVTKAIRRAKMMGIIPILYKQIHKYKAIPLL